MQLNESPSENSSGYCSHPCLWCRHGRISARSTAEPTPSKRQMSAVKLRLQDQGPPLEAKSTSACRGISTRSFFLEKDLPEKCAASSFSLLWLRSNWGYVWVPCLDTGWSLTSSKWKLISWLALLPGEYAWESAANVREESLHNTQELARSQIRTEAKPVTSLP